MTAAYPQASEFVALVMERLGIDPQAEGSVPRLAEMAGIETRYVYRWRAGHTRPSFDQTLRLLDVAGLVDTQVSERLESRATRSARPA